MSYQTITNLRGQTADYLIKIDLMSNDFIGLLRGQFIEVICAI